MIHRCGSLSAARDAVMSALALERLSMRKYAPTMATRISGTQMRPASGRLRVAAAPTVMTIGTTNCATEAPRLPPAALSPSAYPFCAAG